MTRSPRSGRLAIVAIALIGAGVSVGLWLRFRALHEAQTRDEFAAVAMDQAEAWEAGWTIAVESLAQLRAHFEASAAVTEEEFRAFTGATLERHGGIVGFQWMPSIPDSRRAEFESPYHFEGRTTIEIRDRDPRDDFKLGRAASREVYFPIRYSEPRELDGTDVVGWDLVHSAREKVDRLQVSDAPILGGRGILPRRAKPLVHVLLPLFAASGHSGGVPSPGTKLAGFVGMTIDPELLLRTALMNLDVRGIDSFLYDSPAVDPEHLLAARPSRSRAENAVATPPHERGSDEMIWTRNVIVADERWLFACTPAPRFFAHHHSYDSWAFLVAGLLVTLLSPTYLYSLEERQTVIERSVHERTAELRRLHERLVLAVSAADLGWWRYELGAGSETTRNRRFDEILGIDGSVAPSAEKLFECVVPEDRPAALKAFRDAVDTGKLRLDARVRLPDGALRAVEVDGQLERNDAGEPTALVGVLRDVTDRNELERVRSDFVTMLSHDIKNPLGIVLGMTAVLRRQSPQTEEERNAILDDIEVSARRALALAVNFVDATRIESGRLTLRRAPSSVNEVAQRVVREQRTLARTQGVVIEADLAANLPAVSMDAQMIERVATNLVGNAIKFSPRGGVVHVTTARGDHDIRLSVADQGPGIKEEDRAKLFRRYGQINGTVPKEGSGLGLFIVKTIVEAHGGRVRLECPAEGGSVFEMTLPLAATAVPPAAASAS